MADKLRIGVIGTGMISTRHVTAFELCGKAEIVAAADINQQALDAFVSEYKIPYAVTDYRRMLEEVKLDAVTVCTPVFMHEEPTVAALDAGKHVLCEKPMARNSEEARRMVDAAHRSGKLLQIAYHERHMPYAVKAKEIIDSGELGKIYFVKSSFCRWRGRPHFDSPKFGAWFMSKEQAGGGCIMDIGGYHLDLVMGLLDFPEVKSVDCVAYQEIDRERAMKEGVDVEELGVGMVKFRNGCTLLMESAFAVNIDMTGRGVWVFGSEAGLNVQQQLTMYRDDDGKPSETQIKVPPAPKGGSRVLPVAHFVEAILNGKQIGKCSGEEEVIVTRIQELLYQSAEEGREIEFSMG